MSVQAIVILNKSIMANGVTVWKDILKCNLSKVNSNYRETRDSVDKRVSSYCPHLPLVRARALGESLECNVSRGHCDHPDPTALLQH